MKPSIFSICCLFLLALSASAQSSSGDSNPVLQEPAAYTMPKAAVDAGIDGTAVMGIHVDEHGKPTKAWLARAPAWPCGSTPLKALEELSTSLSDAMMKLHFSPALKGGKPVARDIGMTLTLTNPSVAKGPPAPEIDPVSGKLKPRIVSAGVLNGKALSLPTPPYPSEAKANRDSGSVVVQVLIDEQGTVLRAAAISGAATLQFAAREAACGAKFKPTVLAGFPVKVSGVITYNFNL